MLSAGGRGWRVRKKYKRFIVRRLFLVIITRRTFLRRSLSGGVIAIAAASGLLRPTEVLAAKWPKTAFDSQSIAGALKGLYGLKDASDTKKIKIRAPLQAENGAIVPIAIFTDFPDKVDSISILIKENVMPMSAAVSLPKASGFFSARVKMAKTSDVHVVVKSGGKLYQTKQQIKVTVGGCGG